MGDFIMKTNDMIQFTVPPPALIPMLMAPIPLVGTSTKVTIGGVPICLKGDEMPPTIPPSIPYTAPPYAIPGMGALTIMLMPDNLSLKTEQGKAILLKGKTFNATFDVSQPATMATPGGPQPDPLMKKMLTCQFITTNLTVQAG